MKLSLGFSPCPNDTFIFDAIVNHKIDTKGLDFDVQYLDVEELNQKAFRNELDITKLSYHAFLHVAKDYALLNSGSALGNNCGPLLIAKKPIQVSQLQQAKIAIPGKYTTANLLFSIAHPNCDNKEYMIFHAIEDAILNEEVDAGVIIHENRFTYQNKGLYKIQDLGEYWEEQHKAPIPLGGIAVNRRLDFKTQLLINALIHDSIAYAFDSPNSSKEYVSLHAQEMDEQVIKNHISLYVNDYSLELGIEGKRAIQVLSEQARLKDIVSFNTDINKIFID
jgi:1,4-dihydroxy-6-naphthoate synthase